MVSKRVQSIDSSGIRRVFDLAANLKDPVNLSIGQPDFDVPESMKSAAIKAIEAGKNGYTVTQGIPPLRQKIAAKYGVTAFGGTNDTDVFVTSGVSGGLLLSYFALLDPGDEVLVPDPYFCMYRDLAILLGAVPRYYDCYPNFELPLEALEQSITPRTKAIVVNTPNNPTGVALPQEQIDGVIEIARRANIWLIYDEIYEAYSFDRPHPQCFGKYEKTIVLNGFSKSHGMPGWRIGYAVAPTELIAQMLKVQQYTFVCAPAMAQWAMVDGVNADLSSIATRYREKRDFIYSELSGDYEVVKPGGAFYIFPKAPGLSGQRFVERCIENNLLVVPGNVFSQRDSHFRISFSASQAQLDRGVEILKRLART